MRGHDPEWFQWPHISDVLQHYGIPAVRMGGRWIPFRCPLPTHPGEDKRPSAGYNPEKSYFSCFACGEKGSGLTFVRLMEGFTGWRETEEHWTAVSGQERPGNREPAARRPKPADPFSGWG